MNNQLFEFVKKAAGLEFPVNECTATTRVTDPPAWEGNYCATPALRQNGKTLIIERGGRVRAVALRAFETPGQTRIRAGFSSRFNELFVLA